MRTETRRAMETLWGIAMQSSHPGVLYRESSFGHGTLDLLNSTHALWMPTPSAVDQVYVIPQRHWVSKQGGGYRQPPGPAIIRKHLA
eukprot:jgi/Botrbrau1/17049/Bobra.0394s0003.1